MKNKRGPAVLCAGGCFSLGCDLPFWFKYDWLDTVQLSVLQTRPNSFLFVDQDYHKNWRPEKCFGRLRPKSEKFASKEARPKLGPKTTTLLLQVATWHRGRRYLQPYVTWLNVINRNMAARRYHATKSWQILEINTNNKYKAKRLVPT